MPSLKQLNCVPEILESCELLLPTILGKINQNNPLGQTSKLETLGTISQVSVVHFYTAEILHILTVLTYSILNLSKHLCNKQH